MRREAGRAVPDERAMEAAIRSVRSGLGVAAELAKTRVTSLVAFSASCGYFLFSGRVDPGVVLPVAGVFLLASGCSALNQVQEAGIDALMPRTRGRPIPTGRIERRHALALAGALIVLGLGLLARVERNPIGVVALAAFAVLWYNGVYTALKSVTMFAVVVGALVGAIPPMIGWAAAGGDALDPAIVLFASFLFLWQIPHFWLLLLVRGREYEQAGLPSPTRVFSLDQLCRITCLWMLAAAAAGLLVGLVPGVGAPCKVLLLVSSAWLVTRALPLLGKSPSPARFHSSFVHLTAYALAVMTLLTLDALAS